MKETFEEREEREQKQVRRIRDQIRLTKDPALIAASFDLSDDQLLRLKRIVELVMS